MSALEEHNWLYLYCNEWALAATTRVWCILEYYDIIKEPSTITVLRIRNLTTILRVLPTLIKP